MKRIYFSATLINLLLIIAFSFSCRGGNHKQPEITTTDTTGIAVIEFKEYEHDFGTVKEGEKIASVFSFTNAGDADLIVSSAVASCGCTVAKYDKKPISPGKSGDIEVIFDTSGRSGKQTKTVVVQSNARNNYILLRIIADVTDKKK